MKHFFLFYSLLFYIAIQALDAQSNVYYIYNDEVKKVIATQSLPLYEKPSDLSNQITVLKPNSLFIILEHPSNKKDVLYHKAGQWNGAYYNQQFGYFFDDGTITISSTAEEQALTYAANNYHVVYQLHKIPDGKLFIYDKNGKIVCPIYEQHSLVKLQKDNISLVAFPNRVFVPVLYQGKTGYIDEEYLIQFTDYPHYWESFPEP